MSSLKVPNNISKQWSTIIAIIIIYYNTRLLWESRQKESTFLKFKKATIYKNIYRKKVPKKVFLNLVKWSNWRTRFTMKEATFQIFSFWPFLRHFWLFFYRSFLCYEKMLLSLVLPTCVTFKSVMKNVVEFLLFLSPVLVSFLTWFSAGVFGGALNGYSLFWPLNLIILILLFK